MSSWLILRDHLLKSIPSRMVYYLARACSPSKSTLAKSQTFSIIIPCYKNPEFLNHTIASINAQTFPPHEVVIINDGGFKQTSDAISAAAFAYPKLNYKVIIQENKGVAAARNAGIHQATAKWIITLDYDDTLDQNYLFRCAILAQQFPKVDFIYPHSLKINSADSHWIPKEDFSGNRILHRCLYPAFSAFKKNLWTKVGGHQESHPLGMDDWDLFIRFEKNGMQRKRLPFWGGTWRCHTHNETHIAQQHWIHGRAMLYSMTAKWRPQQAVLDQLHLLLSLDEKIIQRLEIKAHNNPFDGYAHLWLGVALLGRNMQQEAIEHLVLAKNNLSTDAWQATYFLNTHQLTRGHNG